jgi:hypothetical protein
MMKHTSRCQCPSVPNGVPEQRDISSLVVGLGDDARARVELPGGRSTDDVRVAFLHDLAEGMRLGFDAACRELEEAA